jgi:hypothetical protein
MDPSAIDMIAIEISSSMVVNPFLFLLIIPPLVIAYNHPSKPLASNMPENKKSNL